MQRAVDTFKDRANEVENYLALLSQMQKLSTQKKYGGLFGRESMPMLKASTFLILYNLIESSIRNAFGSLYGLLEQDGYAFADITSSLRRVWLLQQMDVLKPESANKNSYFDLFEEISQKIVLGGSISLNSRILPISGNLDADNVRKLCQKHGINLVIPTAAKGGLELSTVKAQRNALSHGFKSFVECGREYEISDLKRIYKQTRHFLIGFLRSIEKYYGLQNHKIVA